MKQALGQFWHRTLGRPFRLHYEQFGSAVAPDRQVVLLHGIASDGSFWQSLSEMLAANGYRVTVPDLLGHGKSARPDYITYSTEDQARAVLHLLRRLRLQRVVLVGHSMGSLVATRIAAMDKARVVQLLLYEPPLFADLPEFKTHAKRRKFYYDIFERIASNPTGTVTMARVVARIAKNWTQYLQSEQTWIPIERSLRNTIMQQTSFEELRNIAIQTDIVHGHLDIIVPKAELNLMLKDNVHIRFYRTIDRHGLSKRSCRYLAELIAPELKIRDNKPRRMRNSNVRQSGMGR